MTEHPTSAQMPTDAGAATAVLNAEPDWFRTAVARVASVGIWDDVGWSVNGSS